MFSNFRELEQAKSALSQLQQMVKTIQPEESSSSTPRSKSNDCQSLPKENDSADVKMAAQHREIERLVDSRQRLHNIKDQIASLHQSMATPPILLKEDSMNELQAYEEKLNDSRNIRPTYREQSFIQDDNESELGHFEDDDTMASYTQSHLKQSVRFAMKN